MLSYVLTISLDSEIPPRERKNSNDVDDAGDGSPSGYGWHTLQH